jgi:hypothetical protein
MGRCIPSKSEARRNAQCNLHCILQITLSAKSARASRPLDDYPLTDAPALQPVSTDISEKTGFRVTEENYSQTAMSGDFGGKIAYREATNSA